MLLLLGSFPPLIFSAFDLGLNESVWLSFLFNRLNLLFGAGFIIAILYIKGFIKPRIPFRHVYFMSILSGAVLMLYANWSMYVSETHIRTTLDVIMITMVVSLIMILMLSLKQFGKPFFGNRILKLLGDASYSIYLFHEFFVSMALGFWSTMDKGANPVLVLLCVTVIATVCSITVYWLVERPLIYRLNKFYILRAKYV